MTYTLGVDLGTTYTAAAVARDGRAEVAALGYRATSVPSVVLLTADGRYLVGEAAERRAAQEPDRVAREFKRRVGDPTPLLLGGSPVAVDRCLAEVLRWVVTTVGEAEGGPPAAVTVTHPANWGEFKRDVLRHALRLVDVPGPRLLPEPVAAATWYAQAERMAPGRTVAVYDLGGGTFDTSVLRRRTDGQFESLGHPEGIERLGGIDVDEAVLGHVLRAVRGEGEVPGLDSDDPALRTATAQLRRACVEAKEALSSETSVTIPVWLPGAFQEIRMTRSELEGLIEPLLRPTIEALGRAVASAGLRPHDLDAVLLVGGSSRIPLIAQQVSAGLGRPISVDAHPKHPVALGAALDAAAHVPTPSPHVPLGLIPTPSGAGPAGTAAPGPQTWSPAGVVLAAPGSPAAGAPAAGVASYPSYPSAPPAHLGRDDDTAQRRTLLLASLISAVTLLLMAGLVYLQLRDTPGEAASTGDTPSSTEASDGFTPEVVGDSTAPETTTVPVNLLTTDPAPAVDGFTAIYGTTTPRVRKMVLYTDYAYVDVQVPAQPTYVDQYQWSEGEISGPEPQQLLDMEVEELEAKLFDLSEVNPAVIPLVTQQTLQGCPGEGLELTHVIVERDLVFDDQHRVLLSVYASHPDRGGGGYITFTPDGTQVENHCT